MTICGIDFETQGFKAGVDRTTEVGAKFFNASDFSLVDTVDYLVWDETYPPQPQIIVEVTGITDQELRDLGVSPVEVYRKLFSKILSNKVACFVAHNAPFDKGFFQAEMRKLRGTVDDAELDHVLDIPWVCSIKDIKHPEKFKCKKLSHLALDYGVAIDPENLHRAGEDVEVMIKMLAKAQVNFEEMLGYSRVPDVFIRAMVPSPFGPKGDGGIGKEAAKACGFSWQKIQGEELELKNTWLKKVKENEVESEAKKLGYEVKIVEKGGTNV